MITTNNCCYCVSLRTGSLINGWLQAIVPGLNILAGIYLKLTESQAEFSAISGNFWLDMLVSVLLCVVGIILLYGVYTHRKRFVYYYVCIAAVLLALRFISMVGFVFTVSYADLWASIVVMLTSCLFSLYMLVVIYSYYEKMDSSNPSC